MIRLNTQAGAQVLFDRTFKGTLFSTWDEQPQAFKDDFARTARDVALAVVDLDDLDPTPSDFGEPETGD
jgi:hypothetical protein